MGPIKDSGGRLCIVSEEIVEVLNEYFSSVFAIESEPIVGEADEKTRWNTQCVECYKEDDINILKGLKIDKSPDRTGYILGYYGKRGRRLQNPCQGFLSPLCPQEWCRRIGEMQTLFPCSKKGIGKTLVITDRLA